MIFKDGWERKGAGLVLCHSFSIKLRGVAALPMFSPEFGALTGPCIYIEDHRPVQLEL